LGHVLIVAEFDHEFVARLSVLLQTETLLFRAFGETIPGQRGRHDVECGCIFPSLGKRFNDLGDLDEASWPCHKKVRWQSCRDEIERC
jgi:hypothetical protein